VAGSVPFMAPLRVGEVAGVPSDKQVEVVVFDVNETLSDMTAMEARFADVGAEPGLARTWFAGLLRDGFARTVSGTSERFATLAREGAYAALGGCALDRALDDAVDHVVSGFEGLDVHPDVPGGIRALRAGGLRLVTLSNGAASVAAGLLRRAGLGDECEMLLSVEDAQVWKPAAGAYEYAARRCQVDIAAMMLVAVHPWDVDGAARAGMQTAWVDRAGARYPSYFTTPDRTAVGIDDLAGQLT
jgi:2-haloacid dehalogenase